MRSIEYVGTKEDYDDFLCGRMLRVADPNGSWDEAMKLIENGRTEHFEDFISRMECGF